MSASDGAEKTAHLRVWAYNAVLSLCAIIGLTLVLQSVQTERYNYQSAKYAKSAKEHAEDACLGVDTPAIFECVYDNVERATDHNRAEQDLDAQKDMVLWSKLMLFTTIATLAITAIGVWFVKKTLEATLRAVADTSLATNAMFESNNIAREIGQAQTRAYLSVTNIRPRVRRSQNTGRPLFPSFYLTVKNSGNSVAAVIKATVELRMFSHPFEYMDMTIFRDVDIPDCGVASEIESTEFGDMHFVDGLSMFPTPAEIAEYNKKPPGKTESHSGISIRLSWNDVFGTECRHWAFYIVRGDYTKNPVGFDIEAVGADGIDRNFPLDLRNPAELNENSILEEWRRREVVKA